MEKSFQLGHKKLKFWPKQKNVCHTQDFSLYWATSEGENWGEKDITSSTPPLEYFKTRRKAFVRWPFAFATKNNILSPTVQQIQNSTNYHHSNTRWSDDIQSPIHNITSYE